MQSIKDILAKHTTQGATTEAATPETATQETARQEAVIQAAMLPKAMLPSQHDARSEGRRMSAFNCPICLDRGIVIEENLARPCQCMQQKELYNKFKYARISPNMMQHTFDTFVLEYYSRCLADDEKNRSYYESARLALHGAQDFVNDYLQTGTALGLMFTGPVGSGKTFLACAIANALMAADKNLLFLVVPDLLDELRASIGRKDAENSEQDLLDAARTVPVLILDDLGAHNYTDWTKNRIYSIVNYRMNYQLPTIITTNLDIYELGEYLGDRTSSRILQMCRIYKIRVEQDIRLANYLARENKK